MKTKIVILMILSTVVGARTVQSIRKPILDGGDLNNVAVMVAKDMDPTLFLKDYVFADNSLYNFYTPFYRWLVAQLWQATGSMEVGLIWLTPVVLGLYLVGMFWLMRWITHDNWLALGITVASADYYRTIGEEVWGVADSSGMMARTLFTACSPFLLLALLYWLKKPGWFISGLLGLGIGLSANLHPTSGLQFTFIAAGLLILTYGLKQQHWSILLLLAVAVGIGAAPVLFNFLANTGRPVSPEISFQTFSEIVKLRVPAPFKPSEIEWPLVGVTLKRPLLDGLVWVQIGLILLTSGFYIWGRYRRPQFLRWLWLLAGLAVVGYAYLAALFNLTFFFWSVAFYIIYRFWAENVDALDGWLVTILAIVTFISFAGYYVLIWLWERFELWSATALFLEQSRAARFVYLLIYLLVGRAGLSLALELKKRWSAKVNLSGLTAAVGLVLGFGGGISQLFTNGLLSAWFTFAGLLVTLIGLAWLVAGPGYRILNWIAPAFIALAIILIIFGPLSPDTSAYLPVPTVNLWQPDSLRLGPFADENDAQLYDWVKSNTSRDALFYPCTLGSINSLRFRHNALRSITHAWKDLGLGFYDRASLLSMYERYIKLTRACEDPYLAIATGREVKADFIIASAGDVLGTPEGYICFQNEEYALVALNPIGCVVETTRRN